MNLITIKELSIPMKRIVILSLLALITILSFSAIKAADSVDDHGNLNDPAINDRANACFEGGSLEGKCDSDLLWQAGWYLIRFEHGLLTRADFPRWLIWSLPPEIKAKVTAGAGEVVDMTCYIQVGDAAFQYASPNVLGGANEGDFFWKSPTYLLNWYTPGALALWRDGTWYVGYYGDCGALGVGDPAPADLNIVPSTR